MREISQDEVLEKLKKITISSTGEDLMSAEMVRSVIIRGNNVGFVIEAGALARNEAEELRLKCDKAIKSIPDIGKVTIALTAEITGAGFLTESEVKENKKKYKLILVASGKGGVGKSTVSARLATSLFESGYKVGIADVDIYGPSIPHMFGINDKGKPDTSDGLMVPMESYGVKIMSIGLIIPEGKAAIWRASMAIKAMTQMISGTKWGELDFLIVDMPPGTGDLQLSMVKNFQVDGAVLVTTPQEVALLDVKKAADMFQKTNIPIIGVIENMSYFKDPISGNISYIFGKGGAKKMAKDLHLHFLGELPLDMKIRENADEGKKINLDPQILQNFLARL